MGGSTFIEDESLTVDGAGIGWREDQNQNVIVDNGVITACDGGRVLLGFIYELGVDAASLTAADFNVI